MSRMQRWLAAVDAYQQRHIWLAFPIAVVRKTTNDQGGSLAALIAYYGFLSMFPLLLVFAAGLGFFFQGDPSLKATVLHTTEQSFPVASSYIQTTVSGNDAVLGVGLFGAVWAGLGVARATERAMNSVWDIPMAERPNLWRSRLRALGMLSVLGATFLVSSALAALQQVGGLLEVPARILGTLGPLALNFALFALAFQVLTNRHVAWRSVVPGAALGALGWTALQSLGAYVARVEVAHASHLYGSLAVVIGLLGWILLGAQLTIYSAQVNVVLAFRLWPRSLRRGVHTDADRRSLMRQVAEAQRSVDEVITVHFAEAHAEQRAPDATPARQETVGIPGFRKRNVGTEDAMLQAEQSAARAGAEPAGAGTIVADPGGLSQEALRTHTAVATLVGHLEAFDAVRQKLDVSLETAGSEHLSVLLDVESSGIAEALGRLLEREPSLHSVVAGAPNTPR